MSYTVYCITSPSTDKIYIGTTKYSIRKRSQQHINAYRQWLRDPLKKWSVAYDILKYPDSRIEVIEENTERRREYFYIFNTPCVNIRGKRGWFNPPSTYQRHISGGLYLKDARHMGFFNRHGKDFPKEPPFKFWK